MEVVDARAGKHSTGRGTTSSGSPSLTTAGVALRSRPLGHGDDHQDDHWDHHHPHSDGSMEGPAASREGSPHTPFRNGLATIPRSFLGTADVNPNADTEDSFSTPKLQRVRQLDCEPLLALVEVGPSPVSFTPVLGYLLDEAVGASLFADTPPPPPSNAKVLPAALELPLKPQLALQLQPTLMEGADSGGMLYRGEEEEEADEGLPMALHPIASSEPEPVVGPSRVRRLGQRPAARVEGSGDSSYGGGPGGLVLRVPGELSR